MFSTLTLQGPLRLAARLTLGAFLATPALAPALAHVTADAIEARPGDRIDIALTLGHGCAGQPTTALRIAIPAGLEAIEPQQKEGWQASTSQTEFGWSGGTVPDHQHEEFAFAATVSADAAGQILLPIVQVCDDVQLRWIDADPGSDNPAPLIRVLPAQ